MKRLYLKRIPRPVFLKLCQDNQIKIVKKGKWDIYFPHYGIPFQHEINHLKVKSKDKLIAGIGGCHYLTSKRSFWSLLEKKYGREQASLLMPESYRLDNDEDRELLSTCFEELKPILLKTKGQKRKGISLAEDWKTVRRSVFKGRFLAQKLIKTVYSINSCRMQLRLYVFITAQQGQVKAYLHQNGKCLFSPTAKKMTLYHYVQTEQPSIQSGLPFDLSDLKLLLKEDYQTLIQAIEHNLKLCLLAGFKFMGFQKNLWNNLTFQLFGVDFILTPDLKPYILEVNKGPYMNDKDERDFKLKYGILKDCFDLVGLIEGNHEENQFKLIEEYLHHEF